uniref:Uncharacterized protein n=1 Tax=Oryza brachyantha TaxID=4533 RepID=J3M636_ORYBR
MVTADSPGDRQAGAIDGVELELGESNNAAPPRALPVVEEERPEPRTGRQRRRLLRQLRPASMARACGRWLRHPAHLALLAWALCVAASGSMLGLLLLGALDGAFPRKSARGRWIEVNNQVLNALFTLMSIYQHPALFHHAVMLLRWRPEDGERLGRAYCRKGAGDGARAARVILQPLPPEHGVKLASHHGAAVAPVNGVGVGVTGGDESPLLQRQQGRESAIASEEMTPPVPPLMPGATQQNS